MGGGRSGPFTPGKKVPIKKKFVTCVTGFGSGRADAGNPRGEPIGGLVEQTPKKRKRKKTQKKKYGRRRI